MKIGYITPSLSHGDGWSRYAKGLSDAVGRLPGVEVKVLTSRDSEMGGPNVHKVLPSYPTFRLRHQLLTFFYCLKYLGDCDIIHATFEKPMIGGALACFVTRAKFVMTLHGTYSVPPSGYSPKAVVKRSLMKFAHWVSAKATTGSFNTERKVRELIPQMKECRFIPNGYESEIFYRRPDIGNEGFMLSVGGIKERKGMDVVVHALALLKNEFPKLKYKIIGGDYDTPDGSYYQLLEKIAEENGIRNRVEIRVGKITRTDLAEEYNKCGFFILTSKDSGGHFEGFPLVYFEAMACGAPVIATKGYGSEYAVKNGKNGFLVSYENPQETADAIRKIVGDPNARFEMSKHALASAKEHSWDAIAQTHLLKFYQDVLGVDIHAAKIQFLKPTITDNDIKAVSAVLKSGWLVLGEEAHMFEKNFSNYLGVKHAVLTNSCTSSLIHSLLMAGVGPGDEVITTPMSYVSTSNAILHCGARPVFVDVEPDTGLIDAARIEKAITKKTKAILPVHLYGQMADMKQIDAVAQKHNLAVIEDAAHAIESMRDNIRPGQLGFAACFSFHVAKNITAGQGGAIATNSKYAKETGALLRRDGVRNNGPKRNMEMLGFKHLATDFQAALLNSQLARINKQWKTRKKLYDRYAAAFAGIPGIGFPKPVPRARHACHMFVIWVDPVRRDAVRAKLQNFGIETSIHYEPIHLEPYYQKRFGYESGNFPIAEKIGSSVITLPLYPDLTEREQEYIIRNVIQAVGTTV